MRGKREEIFLHLVWSTWDRAAMIGADVAAWLWPMIGEEARRCGCFWAVVGGTQDHVHMLCAIPATLSAAALAHQVKGASSRTIAARTQAPFRWQGGYGVFSISKQEVAAIEVYVRNQVQHHADASIVPAWE